MQLKCETFDNCRSIFKITPIYVGDLYRLYQKLVPNECVAVESESSVRYTAVQQMCINLNIYFPNGRYIDYLSLTYATNKNKILKLHYKYYKCYKQHSR